jgi:hypothetical protein
MATRPVYALLGRPEGIGWAYREGGHNHSAEDYKALLDFMDMVSSDLISVHYPYDRSSLAISRSESLLLCRLTAPASSKINPGLPAASLSGAPEHLITRKRQPHGVKQVMKTSIPFRCCHGSRLVKPGMRCVCV